MQERGADRETADRRWPINYLYGTQQDCIEHSLSTAATGTAVLNDPQRHAPARNGAYRHRSGSDAFGFQSINDLYEPVTNWNPLKWWNDQLFIGKTIFILLIGGMMTKAM